MMMRKALLLGALLAGVGCTQVSEYTGEIDCGGTTADIDTWMLLETTLGSDEVAGWFGIEASQNTRDNWSSARLEDSKLEGADLEFEVDFGGAGTWDVVLEANDDGGWDGEVDFGTADCDLNYDLETR